MLLPNFIPFDEPEINFEEHQALVVCIVCSFCAPTQVFGLFEMLAKNAVHTAWNHQRTRKKMNPDHIS